MATVVYPYPFEVYPLLRDLAFLKRFPKAIDVACLVHEVLRNNRTAILPEIGIRTTDDFLNSLNEDNPGVVRTYQMIDGTCEFPDYTIYIDVMKYFGTG